MTTSLSSLWQKLAIVLVALIESAAMITSAVKHENNLSKRSIQTDWSKQNSKRKSPPPRFASDNLSYYDKFDLKVVDYNAVFADDVTE